VYSVLAAVIEVLGSFVVACGVLPLTVSAFAYAFVEARHRRAWTSLSLPALRVGGGPYRGGEVVAGRLARAPLLVRAAALGCFYGSWCCLVAWAVVGFAFLEQGELLLLVLAGVVIAAATWRTGVLLLRRDPRTLRFGRRVAVGAAAHAAVVLLLAVMLGGTDWSGPAAVFAGVSCGQAGLVLAATRRHALPFAADSRPPADRQRLPAWLAMILSKRQAQRRANLLTSASQTIPGA
jgi:hypothetical protein